MNKDWGLAQEIVDLYDLVNKINRINAQLKEPDKKKMYDLLVEIKLSYPIAISAIEVVNGDTVVQPYESFSTDKLIQKLLYFRKALYLLGVGKGIEAYIKEESI